MRLKYSILKDDITSDNPDHLSTILFLLATARPSYAAILFVIYLVGFPFIMHEYKIPASQTL